MSVAEARDKALRALSLLKQGIDPVAQERQRRTEAALAREQSLALGVTLGTVVDWFFAGQEAENRI